MSAQILGWIFALVVLVVIFLCLRNARMKEKYGAWWAFIALAVIVMLVPGVPEGLAGFLGIAVPLNLVFFLGSVALLLMQLQYAVELSHMEDDMRRQDEEIALLRQRLDALEGR